jgi:uncharacterized membrane protein YkvA (DUF1232 family)
MIRGARWLRAAKCWAGAIKRDIRALVIAARDPRTPIRAKIVAGAVAAYALSPIDLIPDFVPVLGHLDDLLIVPLGILLAVRLIPAPLTAEFRARAAEQGARPASTIGLAIVVAIWISAGLALLWFVRARSPGA